MSHLKGSTPEELAAYEEQKKVKIYREIMGRANVPAAFQQQNSQELAKHVAWAETFTRLRSFLKPDHRGSVIVLTGKRGCGKTAMAVEAIKWGACHDLFGFFCKLEFFLDQKRGKDVDHVFIQENFADPKIVVIDECGKYSESTWESLKLFNLLDSRKDDQKHTILTCSVLPADLPAFFGSSIADRIHDGGVVLHLDWDSFRGKV